MLTKLTKRLNTLTRFAVWYIFALVAFAGGPLYLCLLAILVLLCVKKRKRRLSAMGTARWADEKDLAAAGMLDADSGLILGRMGKSRQLVRLPQAVHCAIFAPTGAGKGQSFAIPHLRTSPHSTLVIDFKAELARETAEFRRKHFRHRIVLMDPYRSFTQHPDSLNPVDFIPKGHPLAIDDCNDLSAAVVVKTPGEKEPFWNQSAEAVIAAVTATIVAYGEPGTRSLQTVRQIISLPKKMEMATQLMIESDHWGGALAQMGGQLLNYADKERASVISSALRHLRFLGTPAIAESTATSSFDPAELRHGKGGMTVYLILPPERAIAQAGLLRMWIGTMLRACVRGGLE